MPADPEPGRRDPRDIAMQRVRVGVTGLAAVFLLTILAASLLSMLGQDPRPTSPRAAAAARNAAAADATPREPLAELGVAPGNAPKPAPAPPRPAAR